MSEPAGPECEICVEIEAQYTFLARLYNYWLVKLVNELLVEDSFFE